MTADPTLDTSPSALSADERAEWADLGRLKRSAALDHATVERLVGWVDTLTEWAATGGPGLHHREQTDHGPALARSERFADDQAELGAFIRSGIIADVLAELFGEPAVLFKEKINYKLPGGAGFAPHQDAAAYRFVDHHISVMVPIDAATPASGCLEFAPGHSRGLLPTDDRGRIAEPVVADLEWTPVEVEPGDLVFFDSYAPHRSGTNTSDRPRRSFYLTYNASSHGDLRQAYYDDKEAEFARLGESFDGERVRISVSDDFLGRPVEGDDGA